MLTLTNGPRGARAVWLPPDGGTVAASDFGGHVWTWRLDAPTAKPGRVPGDPPPPAVPLGFLGREQGYLLPGGRVAGAGRGFFPLTTAVLADGVRFAGVEWATDQAVLRLCVRSLADGKLLALQPYRFTTEPELAAVPHSALVVGTSGSRLLVFDCDARTRREVPDGGRKRFRGLAAHPSGRLVLAVRSDPLALLLDPHAAADVGQFDPGIGSLTAAVASPDGLLWAAAGGGRVAVWDATG
jgi:hypothetical protein